MNRVLTMLMSRVGERNSAKPSEEQATLPINAQGGGHHADSGNVVEHWSGFWNRGLPKGLIQANGRIDLSRGRLLGIFGIGRRTVATGCAIAFPIWIGLSSCATEVPLVVSAPPSVEKALIGKTKQELLACTAVTPDERMLGDTTQLMFYKEASLLEESFPVSKASFARVHHGCLAHVQLIEGRVQSIHYHPVPLSYAGFDHCDAIFEACLGY